MVNSFLNFVLYQGGGGELGFVGMGVGEWSGTVWLELFIDGPLQAVLLACGM